MTDSTTFDTGGLSLSREILPQRWQAALMKSVLQILTFVLFIVSHVVSTLATSHQVIKTYQEHSPPPLTAILQDHCLQPSDSLPD